jgi:mRNA interferase HicA
LRVSSQSEINREAEQACGTLCLGERFTVVKDLKKELGPGLLSDMCKQIGIRKEDL